MRRGPFIVTAGGWIFGCCVVKFGNTFPVLIEIDTDRHGQIYRIFSNILNLFKNHLWCELYDSGWTILVSCQTDRRVDRQTSMSLLSETPRSKKENFILSAFDFIIHCLFQKALFCNSHLNKLRLRIEHPCLLLTTIVTYTLWTDQCYPWYSTYHIYI